MFRINEMQINVTPLQLINDLKWSLNQNGIYLLSTIKDGTENIQFSCPSHKEGQERKPSCGMLVHDTFKNGKKIEAGTVHCFACGYTATLTEFISFCFGYQDGGIFGNKWINNNYKTTLTSKRREFKVEFNRGATKEELPNISEEILDSFRYTHNYMYQRGLTDDIIDMFDIGYDSVNKCITFPVANIKGEVKWIQTRNIDYKFYKIPPKIIKTDYLYGAYECIKSGAKEVYIVESPLNALTLWKYGKPAIALFGTGGGNQYELLASLPIRHYILALDNDEAGHKGTNILINKLKGKKILSKVIYSDKRDINDLQSECLDLKIIFVNF